MPEDKNKARSSRNALVCCMIAGGVIVFGGAPLLAQSTAASNAEASPSQATRPAGRLVIPPQFDDAWPFSQELARVERDGKWGFIDRTGALVIAPSFEDAESFTDGRAAVKQDGKWGFIDLTGKAVIAPQFQEARRFTEGLAAVKLQGKWGFIDTAGAVLIAPEYGSARSFSEGLAAVTVSWGLGAVKWHFIDKAGKIAIQSMGDERIDYAAEFSDGLAIACHRVDCHFIDRTGKLITDKYPTNRMRVWGFSEGLARFEVRVKRTGLKSGFIDTKGTVVIPPTFGKSFDPIVRLDDAVGAVHVADYRVRDRTNMSIELPSLTRKYVFSEGLAAVEQGDKWGFIDKTGTVVIPATYDGAYRFSDGLALVIDRTVFPTSTLLKRHAPKAMYGYIDKTGHMVIGPYAFEDDVRKVTVKEASDGMVPVVIDGKWGYATRER